MFREGSLYVIRNFLVASNNIMFKTSLHKYKINFLARTQVIEVFDESFPNYMYRFKSFCDILACPKPNDTELFDAIGEVVAKYEPKTKQVKDKPTTLFDIILEDKEKIRMPVTLWGDCADQLNSFLNTNNSEPVIVLLQYCRARIFNGEIRVSNAFNVTKLLINANIDEICEFRNNLLSAPDSSANRISQLSSASIFTIDDDLASGGSRILTMDQLREASEVGSFWVFGTIEATEIEGDWYYLSCTKCPKKVAKVGSRFYCERCDRFDASANQRFKIHVRVIDDTGNACLLIWDRECTQLVGKTAAELKDVVVKESTKEMFPIEIDSLIGKRIFFKVQVKFENIRRRSDVFTVTRLTDDPNVISKHVGSRDHDQESDIFSKLEKTDVDDEKVSSSNDDEVSTPLKIIPNQIESSDIVGESSAKRNLLGDLSSNAPTKKMRAVIKTEKD